MNVKPILFSGPMVRSIRDECKTETRRVVRPQPKHIQQLRDGRFETSPDGGFDWGVEYIESPYQTGDILWVRETWASFKVASPVRAIPEDFNGVSYIYRADDVRNSDGSAIKWRPSIFMPRAAARLFLWVTDVRVERVQEISEDDAWREGVTMDDVLSLGCTPDDPAKCVFSGIWDDLNAKRGYGWDVNPWVWVYTFERIEKPERWCQ
ncbi:MAG: hypothetical protein PHS57_06145 [Alphaproteobacteria bacterium]|nr:hypothetical protein [Alphaproteobacteria bacterium]